MPEQTEIPTEKFETEWCNYWDANPEDHGGTFVRWDLDHECWKIVEVTPGTFYPDGVSEDEAYCVEQFWIYPDNVWNEGDPSKGFEREMKMELESLGDFKRFEEHPASPPFIDRIAYYVAGLTKRKAEGRRNWENMADHENYEALVADYGVDEWE